MHINAINLFGVVMKSKTTYIFDVQLPRMLELTELNRSLVEAEKVNSPFDGSVDGDPRPSNGASRRDTGNWWTMIFWRFPSCSLDPCQHRSNRCSHLTSSRPITTRCATKPAVQLMYLDYSRLGRLGMDLDMDSTFRRVVGVGKKTGRGVWMMLPSDFARKGQPGRTQAISRPR
jgi:hypothetical protein